MKLTSCEDYILKPSTVIKRRLYSLTTYYISHFPDWILLPRCSLNGNLKFIFRELLCFYTVFFPILQILETAITKCQCREFSTLSMKLLCLLKYVQDEHYLFSVLLKNVNMESLCCFLYSDRIPFISWWGCNTRQQNDKKEIVLKRAFFLYWRKQWDTRRGKRMTAWGFMEVFWDQWNICKYVWLVCGEKRKAGAMDLYQNGPGGGGRSPSGCSGCHRTLLLAAFSFRCLTGRHYWIYHIFICMCPFKIC